MRRVHRARRRRAGALVRNARLSGELHSQVRQIEQFNVAGLVPGTDPALRDELVIYSAHWDHLGKTEGSGDVIYNGAIDNASGTAALLAMAKTAVQHPAKRTQMFLWVAAEEQGLLGSAGYVEKPLWPLAKTAAALNLDAMNFVGITRDMGVQGSERKSSSPGCAVRRGGGRTRVVVLRRTQPGRSMRGSVLAGSVSCGTSGAETPNLRFAF